VYACSGANLTGTCVTSTTNAYFSTQAATIAPTPQSPSGNQVISTLTPTLTWSGGSGFSSLQINVSKSPYGSANIVYTSSTLSAGTTSVQVPSGKLVAGTDYRWDVYACSGANLTGTCVTSTTNAYFSTQAGLIVVPPSRSVGATAGTTSFSVSNAGTDYSASVTSGSSWLTITSGENGSNTGTINVFYVENPGAQRSGTIQVTANGAAGSPVTVTVMQAASGANNVPFSGKGDWIVNIYAAIANNLGTTIICRSDDNRPHTSQNEIRSLVQQLIDFERANGIEYLIVKAGQGNHFYPASPDCPKLDAAFVQMAHAAGMKVYGFHYVYGGAYDAAYNENTEVSLEIQVALQILATGADGLVIDAELEYEDGQPDRRRVSGPGTLPSAASAADSYCQGILNGYPGAILAYSPIWKPSDHPGFPYTTFNKYSAVVMPQAYASAHATPSQTWLNPVTPAEMIRLLDNAWTSAQNVWISQDLPIIPIIPVAYAAPPVTGQEITEFVDALKNDPTPATSGGYRGVNFFDADSNDADIRAAIRAASIGPGPGESSPVVTQHPQNQTVAASQTATFTAAATGTPPPTVRWQQSVNAGMSFSDMPGQTSTTLSFVTTTGHNGLQFRAMFTNTVASMPTNAATLTVNSAGSGPAITLNPANQAVTAGQGVTFTAAASGALAVQWQRSTNGSATFANIPGATSTTYALTASASYNGYRYQAAFSNSEGSATTSPAVLAVDSAPLQETSARTFVSSYGNDDNPCSRAAPCRTFQAAHYRTFAKGEINVLDPAGYGAVTITKSISIVNDGVGSAGVLVASGADGITINAGPNDVINLRGLTIEGAALGRNGIQFNTGKSLVMTNCVIRNLTSYGISLTPNASTSFTFSNVFVANNIIRGITLEPTGSGKVAALFNRIELHNNGASGLAVQGDSSAGTIDATVTESVSNNNSAGFIAFSTHAVTNLMVTRSTATNSVVASNSGGVGAIGGMATLRLSRSTVQGNSVGWTGAVLSYGDNYIDGNVVGNEPPPIIPRK
jgi:hypothetical protein